MPAIVQHLEKGGALRNTRPPAARHGTYRGARSLAARSLLWGTAGSFLGFPFQRDVQEVVPPVPELEELGWKKGFSSEWDLRGCLGRGSVGEVRIAVHRQTGQEYAVKTMSKVRRRFTRAKTLDKIRREVQMMRRLQCCPSVVRLVETYEDPEEVHLVQEMCRGGDLMRYIQANGSLDEHNVAVVAAQVLQFVNSCHQQEILYGDLKPANFCLVDAAPPSPGAPIRVRAIDFGNSVTCSGTQRLSKRRGTLTFLSPEAYQQDYGLKADLWSLGVMLYWLFTSRYPFWSTDEPPTVATVEDMQQLVSTAPILYTCERWALMSPEGVDFIQRCLERNEAARMSVAQALEHPWLQQALAQHSPSC